MTTPFVAYQLLTTVGSRVLTDDPKPKKDVNTGLDDGLNTLLGVITEIGPYVFLGGILLGAIALVIFMAGHGEMKGLKFIVISIIAAVVFGASGTMLKLFT